MSVARIGRADPADQVNKAVASVKLEGLLPSSEAIQLAEEIAYGRIEGEEAIRALTSKYRGQCRSKKRGTYALSKRC